MKSFIETKQNREASNIIELLCFQLLDKVVTFLYQHVQGLQEKEQLSNQDLRKNLDFVNEMLRIVTTSEY